MPDQQRQGQTGLFATGEAAARGTDHVAMKIEAAQIVAQLLLARGRFLPRQVPERRLVRAQLFQLVLGEIADHQVAPRAALTDQGLQLAGQ